MSKPKSVALAVAGLLLVAGPVFSKGKRSKAGGAINLHSCLSAACEGSPPWGCSRLVCADASVVFAVRPDANMTTPEWKAAEEFWRSGFDRNAVGGCLEPLLTSGPRPREWQLNLQASERGGLRVISMLEISPRSGEVIAPVNEETKTGREFKQCLSKVFGAQRLSNQIAESTVIPLFVVVGR